MITCRPNRTVVTSFHPQQRHERTSGEAVVAIAPQQESSSSSNAAILVCALSNGAIKLYDRSTLRLVSTMHAEADVAHVCHSSPFVVVAASKNGIVTAFDLRQQQQENPHQGVLQQRITGTEGTISSMDFCAESSTIALGGSHGIYLWDWRHPKHVALLAETHQNITQVRFAQRNRLVSTGDSLLCLLDCTNACETALCIIYTGKSSVHKKLGFCGNDGSIVYCVSTDNTVSLWNLPKGQCFHQTGIHHLRQKARSTSFMNTIVDCAFDPHHQTLSLLASNYSGDAVIFSLQNATAYHAYWQATQSLVGGHRGVVTAWSGNHITGGSDARICEWMLSSTTTATSTVTNSAGTVHNTFQPLFKRQRYDAE